MDNRGLLEDLKSLGFPAKIVNLDNGADYVLVDAFLTQKRARVATYLCVEDILIRVATMGLFMGVQIKNLPFFLNANSEMVFGKFFINQSDVPEFSSAGLTHVVEYGFELPIDSYSKELMKKYLDTLIVNLEHYITKFSNQGIVKPATFDSFVKEV